MASASHFTWLKDLPQSLQLPQQWPAEVLASPEKLVFGTALGAALILLARKASLQLRTAGPADFVIPQNRLNLFSIFDLFVEGFAKFHDSVLGRENRKYMSLSATVFLFIFCSNLLSLVPGMAGVTTTVWINVAIALVVFVYFNYLGIREHGLVHYLKHFGGPVWWAAWFIFPLEMFSTFLRIVTLNLRLYWNMTADHMVLFNFLEMAPVPIPVIFYFFGTFVCFMQAFVFTILTMVYVLLATQHEEDH